jgi:hypothetical protein
MGSVRCRHATRVADKLLTSRLSVRLSSVDLTHHLPPLPPPAALWQLASTEEYIDGQFAGNLGEVLIR